MIGWLGALKPCAGDWWESVLVGSCPGPSNRFPQQPVNSWSSFAYAVAGAVVLVVEGTPESRVFAVAMGLLALGSFLYHAWPTIRTAALDHAGMYAVFIALATYLVGGSWWAMALGAGVGAYLFRFAFRLNLNVMMGTFLWFALVASWGPLAWISVGLFGLAMSAWLLDRNRWLLGRWGHGLWHGLTAAAIALMYVAQGG